jgi:hypothetical protein
MGLLLFGRAFGLAMLQADKYEILLTFIAAGIICIAYELRTNHDT